MRAEAQNDEVIPGTASGVRLFYAGPHITMLDRVGLGDALLRACRLRILTAGAVGHALRAIPAGYVEARQTGDTSKMEPSLAQYYQKLRLVTSGDLFSWERLKTILGFQLGCYDHWLKDYIANLPPPAIARPVAELLAAHPSPILQPALNFKGQYLLAFNDIAFGKVGVEVAQDASHYKAEADVTLTGTLPLFVNHSSHAAAAGSGSGFSYPDIVFDTHYHTNQKLRSAHLVYRNGAWLEETLTPPKNPWKDKPINAEMKKGSVDPLSGFLVLRAGLAAAMAKNQPGFLLTLYDGRRLVQVEANIEGTQKIHYHGAWVPVVAVSVKGQPVAGFNKGRDNVSAMPVLYFSDDMRLLPLKMEISLPLGSITATLSHQCGSESCLLGN